MRCATIDCGGERGHERVVVGGAGERAGAGEQLVLGALGDDLAVADDDDLVGDALDLVEQVRAEQHGAALVGVAAQQVAHPADAGRVEAVGRLVEDEDLGVAEERVGDAEALAHAEGVVADPAVRLLLGEADELDHLVDAVPADAHEDNDEVEEEKNHRPAIAVLLERTLPGAGQLFRCGRTRYAALARTQKRRGRTERRLRVRRLFCVPDPDVSL